MKSRYTVLALSVVLALALAVPALGGPSNPVATTAVSVAKALKVAKKAKRKANDAQTTADTALNTANTANNTANTANSRAINAQNSANAAQTAANNANTAATNANNNANTRFDHTSQANQVSAVNSTDKSVTATCPAGTTEVTGGGFGIGDDSGADVAANLSAPYGDSWVAGAQEINATADTWSVTAYIVCAGT